MPVLKGKRNKYGIMRDCHLCINVLRATLEGHSKDHLSNLRSFYNFIKVKLIGKVTSESLPQGFRMGQNFLRSTKQNLGARFRSEKIRIRTFHSFPNLFPNLSPNRLNVEGGVIKLIPQKQRSNS